MHQHVTVKAEDVDLEAELFAGAAARAVVVTHPHPLYGGDMHNPVVGVIIKAYQQQGWSTLRFNFRGTGNSQGRFEDGIGETADVTAAIRFLAGRGYTQIDLCGYSFGARVLALWAQTDISATHRIIMVAPPVAFMDFSGIGQIPTLRGVIAGSRDEIAPPARIRSLITGWHPDAPLRVIKDADHFFWPHFDALQNVLIALIG